MKLEMPDSNMSENSKYSLLLLGSVLLLVFVVLYIMQPLREDIQKNEQEFDTGAAAFSQLSDIC